MKLLVNTETDYLKKIAEGIASSPKFKSQGRNKANKYSSTGAKRLEKEVMLHLNAIKNHVPYDIFYLSVMNKLVHICDILFDINSTVSPDVLVIIDLLTSLRAFVPGEITANVKLPRAFIDGVYSQDGDLAPLKAIIELCKHYGAKLMVDDAHGTGVIGKTGRGLIETCDAWDDIDLITGTFSKTFGHIGGYMVASEEMVNYLKYQSKQHLFSASLSPACLSIVKAIELIDEEPLWMSVLKDNCKYFRHGLLSLGLNIGETRSAIFPVRIGDKIKNARICHAMKAKGVYANQINYPAVSMKDARIRMGVTARHTKEQLDKVLNERVGSTDTTNDKQPIILSTLRDIETAIVGLYQLTLF
jgi:hypothetical protein